MPTITIDKPLRGISRQYVNPSTGIEGLKNEYSKSTGIDLFRPGFEGHISPAAICDQAGFTSNVNSIARAYAVDSTTGAAITTYFILGGLSGVAPRIYKISNGAYTSNNDVAAHGGHNFTTISTGTGFWGEDVVLYAIGTTSYIFYSWNDSADGDLGMFDLNTTYTDNWLSTVASGGAVLTKNVPHKLTVGNDNKMYGTNGRYVFQIDGSSGSGVALMTKYDCGQGWMAFDVKPWGQYLMIVMSKIGDTYNWSDGAAQCRVALWDYSQTGLGIVVNVDDYVATALKMYDNIPYLLSQGRNYTGKVWQFTGTKFKLLKEWPLSVYGTAPMAGSVEIFLNNILWVPQQPGLYGDSSSGLLLGYNPEYGGLHRPVLVSDGTNTATTIGVLANTQQGQLYVGGVFGGTYKIALLNPSSGYASSVDFRSGVIRVPYKANINKVRVYFSQMKSGSSVLVSIFRNYITAAPGGTGDMLNKTLSFSSNGELTEWQFEATITKVSAFYINLRLTGQISVSRVEVDVTPYSTGGN